jgi:hypothetical protein
MEKIQQNNLNVQDYKNLSEERLKQKIIERLRAKYAISRISREISGDIELALEIVRDSFIFNDEELIISQVLELFKGKFQEKTELQSSATKTGEKHALKGEKSQKNDCNSITLQIENIADEGVLKVYRWASLLQGEVNPYGAPILLPDSWVKLARRLALAQGQLWKVIGSQGMGKTTFAKWLYSTLSQWGLKCKQIRIQKGHEAFGEFEKIPLYEEVETGFLPSSPKRLILRWFKEWEWKVDNDIQVLLIDLWDHQKNMVKDTVKALDALQDYWSYRNEAPKSERRGRPGPLLSIVVFLQKEHLPLNFFLGKMETFELEPFKAEELVDFYRSLFGSFKPFSESALRKVAEFARGNFRQFKRGIANVIAESDFKRDISVDDVRKILLSAKFAKDMELRLCEIFPRSKQRRLQAIRVIQNLREKEPEPLTQRQLEQLFPNKMACSRILNALALAGFLEIQKAARNQNLVKLKGG